MTKLTFESPDLTARNISRIEELFPNCVTEALDEERSTPERKVYKKAVNFELLKQMLSPEVIDGEEAYEFTWVGKKAAIVEANKPIRKTLRPCPEESKNWDSTENLYIEGDNLEVLKLLQESYLGKVKMIYIDPPYNTGHDFIYPDSFIMDNEEYNDGTGYFDEDGNVNYKRENSEAAGKYHSDWCSMIYSRLMLARNLLTDDGVIFISIDDNEVENLKKICSEVFGTNNFVAVINWKGRGGRQDSKYYAAVHEYILVYAKNIKYFQAGEEVKSGDVYPKYDEVKKRFYKTQLLRKWGSNSRREDRPNLFYPITAPDGTDVYPMLPKEAGSAQNLENFGCWRHGASTMKKNIEDGKVEFVKGSDGQWIAYEKIFAPLEGEEKTKKYTTWIDETNDGTSVVKELFSKAVFDYPKTPALINRFFKMAGVEEDDIILDFFSGSATTAHAVMQLNAEDGGHRKFIMVQLPEPCAEDSEAFKAGYKNICEIGKERIRRAGEKIVNDLDEKRYLRPGMLNPSDPNEMLWDKGVDIVNNKEGQGLEFSDSDGKNKRKESYSPDSYMYHPENLDTGFRVLKLDDTNMKDVYYSPVEYDQQMLDGLESNIKDDRTDLDLLFGCLLDWGLPLSLPYTSEKIDGFTVHTYNGGDLIACFDENISDAAIKEIAKRQPLRAVFRDSSFNSSPEKINVGEIFKMLAPDTRVKVI